MNAATQLQSFIPMTRQEMQARGWEQLDVLLISGDAYVDHPAFGVPLLARLLESKGFKVGIIAQPTYPGSLVHSDNGQPATQEQALQDLKRLGIPRLFVGIGAGVVDSRVSNFTAHKKRRSDDAYAPGGRGGFRPDEATLVYTQLARAAFADLPVVIGGVEASLRRLAHYDYWRHRVRRSLLSESGADLLLFGMAEASLLKLTRIMSAGVDRGQRPRTLLAQMHGERGVAWRAEREVLAQLGPHVTLPAFRELRDDKGAFARAARIIEAEANPWIGKTLVQEQGGQGQGPSMVVVNPALLPLSSGQLDALYALPFSRQQHPLYLQQAMVQQADAKAAQRASRIPALDTVRFSITVNRGCFGGCSFCAIGLHQGKAVQSRSAQSVLNEVDSLTRHPDFKGVISDLGGPTANMFHLGCTRPDLEQRCRRPSCLYPGRCPHLGVDHGPQLALLRKVRQHPKVRRAFVASGLRHDLIDLKGPYLRELLQYHVGGHLKVAPEHADDDVLALMRKPSFASFEDFASAFTQISSELGKEQYLVPYFISAFPGSTEAKMARVGRWLDSRHWRLQQVQSFIPLPMTLATAMYWTGMDLKHKTALYVARSEAERRRQQRVLLGSDRPHKRAPAGDRSVRSGAAKAPQGRQRRRALPPTPDRPYAAKPQGLVGSKRPKPSTSLPNTDPDQPARGKGRSKSRPWRSKPKKK